MPIIWNLRKWLALNRDIYRPADLQLLLRERAGVILSHQSVASLMHGTPSALRLQTIQALCTALDCKLSDFCEVLPGTDTDASRTRKRKAAGGATEPPRRLYGANRPGSAAADASQNPFPTPYAFYPQPDHPGHSAPADMSPADQSSTNGKRSPSRRRPSPPESP